MVRRSSQKPLKTGEIREVYNLVMALYYQSFFSFSIILNLNFVVIYNCGVFFFVVLVSEFSVDLLIIIAFIVCVDFAIPKLILSSTFIYKFLKPFKYFAVGKRGKFDVNHHI